jgi:hypothetical protein
MGATATTPAGLHAGRERRSLPRRSAARRPGPGRATLDDRITALWDRLVADGAADCPVCGSELPAGRPCETCGSELS